MNYTVAVDHRDALYAPQPFVALRVRLCPRVTRRPHQYENRAIFDQYTWLPIASAAIANSCFSVRCRQLVFRRCGTIFTVRYLPPIIG